MLTGQCYITDTHLVLRSNEGPEQSMMLQDALDLLSWLEENKGEMAAKVLPQVLPTWAKIRGLETPETGDLMTRMTGTMNLAKGAASMGVSVPEYILTLIEMQKKGHIEVEFFIENSDL